jgi:glycosyltransferase involved in cell wall biosynthesis
MSKIIINARFLTQSITGVQRFAVEICRELRKLDSEILFVSPHNIVHSDLAEEFAVKIVGKRIGHYWEKIELPNYINRHHMDALLVNLCNSAPLFYRKQIVTLHDVAVYKNPSWFSKLFVILYKLMSPIIVKNAKRIITVSQFSKDEIVRFLRVDPDKIDVISNSVSHFHVSAPTTPPLINGKYILCVGSVEPRKNLIRLLKAFSLINTIEYKLVVVGGKNKLFNGLSLDTELNDDTLDNIIFTGYVSDDELINLYSNAIAFIYPSLYEGFGIPPLEAMKFGCPTIVSNISSLPEICDDASLYVDPFSVESIQEGLLQLILSSDTRERLIEKGSQQVLKFSWQKSASLLYSIIKTYSN